MTSLLNIAGNVPTDAFAEGSSLRFEDGDSPYLSWTPASAGNRKTYTWSSWVKRGNLTSYMRLFQTTSTYSDSLILYNDDTIVFWGSDASTWLLQTNAVFRDVSAWYHIVVSVDTTQATASDRMKIYVNNELQTLSTATYPSQNTDCLINNTQAHYIGTNSASGQYLDGYLANVAFIDGQALTPTSFGEYEDTLWKPKSDTDIQALTFGTNGFYLPMKQTTEAEGFSTVTYTGNGGTQSIEGVGFEPDFVWVKARNFAGHHVLVDSVRGTFSANRYGRLFSNTTAAEDVSSSDTVTSLDADGFGVNSAGSGSYVNDAGDSYVAWCWDAGSGSAVSNTDGSITSTVKANTTNGFSIVSYTGTGANATIGHGLNSAPEMIIFKERDANDNWSVYHTSIGNTYKLRLNGTNAQIGPSANLFNSTSPTSTVFSTGTDGELNGSMIAYCFHSVSGYSSIGSFSGTGATGNAVTTGFEPAFVMIKRTDIADSWAMFDNTRDTNNPNDQLLYAERSDAESTNTFAAIDFDSNGFTVNGIGSTVNNSGGNYIYMAFADTRDATFFGDTSGNSNNWTPNKLNNTDVVPDSPVTNWCTMNPLDDTGVNTSEGNLKVTPSSDFKIIQGTFACNKNYFEGRFVSGGGGSIQDMDFGVYASNGNFTRINGNGSIYKDGSLVSSNTAYGVGDIVGIAVDVDSGTIQFYRNGTANGSAATVNTTDEYLPHFRGANARVGHLNFGQDSSFAGNETPQGNTDDNGQGDFYYAPPSGFLALNRNNLPTPDILDPADYFNTVLYTGTGAAISVTGVGFQPDFLWIKTRSFAQWHALFDSVRGASIGSLSSNTTGAETTTQKITSFDADGFTDSDGTYQFTNTSGETHVAWNWLAGGTAVSNTDGSITSQVSANTDAGFSVVGFTGNGTAGATVGHGLAQDLDFLVIKNRDSSGSWVVQRNKDDVNKYLYLNDTRAESTSTAFQIDITRSNDGTWAMGGVTGSNNSLGVDYIAYCFHSVESYSKCGVYTGNGSSDGTYVHCGFRPAFVMIKRTDGITDWMIKDNQRPEYNPAAKSLRPNQSAAEFDNSNHYIDLLSNGFKCKGTDNMINASSGSYIFLAFSEAPFKNANAR